MGPSCLQGYPRLKLVERHRTDDIRVAGAALSATPAWRTNENAPQFQSICRVSGNAAANPRRKLTHAVGIRKSRLTPPRHDAWRHSADVLRPRGMTLAVTLGGAWLALC